MVYIIPFPVLKIDFALPGLNEKHFVKEYFDMRPVWKKLFPVFKINFKLPGLNDKHFIK